MSEKDEKKEPRIFAAEFNGKWYMIVDIVEMWGLGGERPTHLPIFNSETREWEFPEGQDPDRWMP